MTPISPVIPGCGLPEIVYAKDQPQYIPLPALELTDGAVVTRWKLSLRERLQVLLGGNIWLTLLTFHQPLQPVMLGVKPPELEFSKNPAGDFDDDKN